MSLTRPELEALMAQTFGEDWKTLVLVGPVGDPIRLRDIPEECGFPPVAPSTGYGLWQIMPAARLPARPLDPLTNARAAFRLAGRRPWRPPEGSR